MTILTKCMFSAFILVAFLLVVILLPLSSAMSFVHVMISLCLLFFLFVILYCTITMTEPYGLSIEINGELFHFPDTARDFSIVFDQNLPMLYLPSQKKYQSIPRFQVSIKPEGTPRIAVSLYNGPVKIDEHSSAFSTIITFEPSKLQQAKLSHADKPINIWAWRV